MNIPYSQMEILDNYRDKAESLFRVYQNGKSKNKTENIEDLKFQIIAYKTNFGRYRFTLKAVYNSWYYAFYIQEPSQRMILLAEEKFGNN